MSSLTLLEKVVTPSKTFELHWKENGVLQIMEKKSHMDVVWWFLAEGVHWLQECLQTCTTKTSKEGMVRMSCIKLNRWLMLFSQNRLGFYGVHIELTT